MTDPTDKRSGSSLSVVPHEPRRFEPVSDQLILAAVERAERHSRARRPGVTHADVADHLGFDRTGATTRKLRPQLASLLDDGSLTRRSRGSGLKDLWALTDPGRRRLAAACRHGRLEPLPESPQHREWRARKEACGRLPAIYEGAMNIAEEALDYLASSAERRPPGSAHASGIGRRFAAEFRRFAKATYCLQEWPEPDDAHLDMWSTSVFDLRTAEPQ
jgi:hypothetical protein